MKKTGIIGAMPEEIALLKEHITDITTETIAGIEFISGNISEKPVTLAQCGIGKVNAGICAQIMITHSSADMIINTGCAGTLDSSLKIGDIVISEDAVQHDFDITALGFAKGEIPFTGISFFKADEKLANAAAEAASKTGNSQVRLGRICSGDSFISRNEQKTAITDSFGGSCCEMEGAAIAQVCYLNNVPFVIIRAISDNADEGADISFDEFKKTASVISSNVILEMLRTM